MYLLGRIVFDIMLVLMYLSIVDWWDYLEGQGTLYRL